MTSTDDNAAAESAAAESAASSSDPSGYVTNPPSTFVKVVGTAREDINGRIGIVQSYSSERSRYAVWLLRSFRAPDARNAAADAAAARASAGAGVLSFKVENLAKASMLEKAKAQTYMAWDDVQVIAKGLMAREDLRRAYTSLQTRLPGGLKLRHVGAALLTMFFVSIRTFGLSKTALATSLSILTVSVILPDILAGNDIKTAARNFPRHWRNSIAKATGFNRITEKQALAGFAFFFILAVKMIMAPSPQLGSPAKNDYLDARDIPQKPPSHRQATAVMSDPAEIYMLGFQDSKEGREYGTSLPKNLPDLRTVEPNEDSNLFDGNPSEWDLNPPPPPPAEEKVPETMMGAFRTTMSGFTLYKFFSEACLTPQGQFQPRLFMTNVKLMPSWKVAAAVFCMYNVLRPFL